MAKQTTKQKELVLGYITPLHLIQTEDKGVLLEVYKGDEFIGIVCGSEILNLVKK